MSWGHFEQNRHKISVIESRVKQDGKMPKPIAIPADKERQKAMITQYLNGVIQNGKDAVAAEKIKFHKQSVAEVYEVAGALPLDANGETILAEQRQAVKNLAKREGEFFQQYDIMKQEFRKHYCSLEGTYHATMENWMQKERGHGENGNK